MSDTVDPVQYAKSLGYSEEELRGVPEGLVCHGCGNPVALAELQEGEIVLDLGSGGGLDVFLAAKRVGPTGRVIGVDSSAEVVAKAAEAASKGGYTNVVFKVGQMEQLPLEEESVDVVISNCVINHAADKLAVFREVFRCLRPGGKTGYHRPGCRRGVFAGSDGRQSVGRVARRCAGKAGVPV